jgi:hypothetical protein
MTPDTCPCVGGHTLVSFRASASSFRSPVPSTLRSRSSEYQQMHAGHRHFSSTCNLRVISGLFSPVTSSLSLPFSPLPLFKTTSCWFVLILCFIIIRTTNSLAYTPPRFFFPEPRTLESTSQFVPFFLFKK